MEPLDSLVCILPQIRDTYTNMEFDCQQLIMGSTHRKTFINCKFPKLIAIEFSSDQTEETFIGCIFPKLRGVRKKGGTSTFVRCVFHMTMNDKLKTDLCYDCSCEERYDDFIFLD